MGARAFAVGQDIHFGAGEYDPESRAGETLLAHEVSHTVQQAGGAESVAQAKLAASQNEPAEQEADRAASAMVDGQPATVGSTPLAVAAKPSDELATGAEPALPPPEAAADYNAVVALARQGAGGARSSGGDAQHDLDGLAHSITARLASANRIAHGLTPFERRRALQPGALRATDAAFGILRKARGFRAGRSAAMEALAHLLDVHREWMQLPALHAEQYMATEPAPARQAEAEPRVADGDGDPGSAPGPLLAGPHADELGSVKDAFGSLMSKRLEVLKTLSGEIAQVLPATSSGTLNEIMLVCVEIALTSVSAGAALSIASRLVKKLGSAGEGLIEGVKAALENTVNATLVARATEKLRGSGSASGSPVPYLRFIEAQGFAVIEARDHDWSALLAEVRQAVTGRDPEAASRIIQATTQAVEEEAANVSRLQHQSSLAQWLAYVAHSQLRTLPADGTDDTERAEATLGTDVGSRVRNEGGGDFFELTSGLLDVQITARHPGPVRVEAARLGGVSPAIQARVGQMRLLESRVPMRIWGYISIANSLAMVSIGINEQGALSVDVDDLGAEYLYLRLTGTPAGGLPGDPAARQALVRRHTEAGARAVLVEVASRPLHERGVPVTG